MEGMTAGAAIARLPLCDVGSAAPTIPRARLVRSQLEVVRRRLDAYNRRDLAALCELSHPHVEVDWSASRGPNAGVYRGIDAMLDFYEDWFSTFREVDVAPERMLADGSSVVVPNLARMRGRYGIEVVARSVLVYTVSGLTVTSMSMRQVDGAARLAA
jgi:ketosteroid isomerase-like protein